MEGSHLPYDSQYEILIRWKNRLTSFTFQKVMSVVGAESFGD